VITRSLEIASHSAKLHHIEVRQDLDVNLPEIMADFDQLQQVFINLIMNAIQAMPDSGVLTLSTRLENNFIHTEVKDTGCGISEENMYSLFTPFFTTKDANKGVGLGLAVAHGLIENHKGRINVESTEGEGTTFTVLLPVTNDEQS
jgi:signal transduction histidine kinase